MAIHSLVKIWVHLIWGTHNHEKTITKKLELNLFAHLMEKATEEDIHIERMKLRPEHVHMLFELPSTKTMEDVAKMFKGESSHWVNVNNIIRTKFRWQRGYGAFSVSASQLNKVKNYIKNQDKHHAAKSFSTEYEEWRRKYGIHID